MYESEYTQFIRKLLEQRPHLAEDQRRGRAIWWDKKINFDELNRYREATVAQEAYVYHTKGTSDKST